MYFFQINQTPLIALEYISNNSLYHHLHVLKTNLKSNKIKIIKNILKALVFMHEMKICHKDIKSHNIILDKNL